jgi:hypothetical protein
LIGHDVGYVFYDQKGIAGLPLCVHSIGDACIHALVTEEFLHEGTGALSKMSDFCMTFPKDSVTYANCFHGMGHGILAFLGYDYGKAVPECLQVYDRVLSQDQSAIAKDVWGECVGGLTMEMFQGKHDPAAWQKMKLVYTPSSDPLAPCDASFMPKEVLMSCYLYINGRLASLAGASADGNFSRDAVYAKALSYCAAVPDLDGRRACYGGVGVTFLFAVTDSDLRKFATMTTGAMRQVNDWCMLAQDSDGASACILTAAEVLLGGGEHGVRPAAEFCGQVSDPVFKDRCYADVVVTGRRYLPFIQFNELCGLLPETYRASCSAPPAMGAKL